VVRQCSLAFPQSRLGLECSPPKFCQAYNIDEEGSALKKSDDIIEREKSFKVKDFDYFYFNSF
jgi:hypothetical protein